MYTLKSYGSMRHKEWMFRLEEFILPATECLVNLISAH